MKNKAKCIIWVIIFSGIAFTLGAMGANSYLFASKNGITLLSPQDKQQLLLNSPVRDISADEEIISYLKEHKVFISLTTSPSRIKYLTETLKTLDLRNVENILLALPEKYSRNAETYVIPDSLLHEYPKLKLLRFEKDLGPISKLLPAVEYAKQIDAKAIVITIDDDIMYPFGMVNELIRGVVKANVVVAGAANNYGEEVARRIKGDKINFFHSHIYWQGFEMRKRQFVSGFGGVGYRADWLDVVRLKELSQLSKDCFRSDDAVISYFLNKNNVPIAKLKNSRYNHSLIWIMSHGEQEDALHRMDANEVKYEACYKAMQEYR